MKKAIGTIKKKKTFVPIETDFHGVKCHWNEKMLLSLYGPLHDNSIYMPAETKVSNIIINIYFLNCYDSFFRMIRLVLEQSQLQKMVLMFL